MTPGDVQHLIDTRRYQEIVIRHREREPDPKDRVKRVTLSSALACLSGFPGYLEFLRCGRGGNPHAFYEIVPHMTPKGA